MGSEMCIRDRVSVGSSNLPVVEEIVAGFPATDLYALYLAEEGANGQAHAGAFLDSSGHDRHAVLAPLWGQPIKESYGFTVPVNGIPIHTPLTLGGSFSVVMAVQIAAEGASAVNYANLLSPKASINVNIATGANPSNKRFAVNALLQQTSGALGNVAIFAGDGSNIPGVTPANQRAPVPGSSGNVPKVIGLAFDKSAGALYLTDGLGRQAVTVSAEALKTWMDQYLSLIHI